ncbi:NAD-dependent epimerase/dehydratase family protein [Vibrio ostreicida]|uniref:NAD-dependent epimerase/dehydratase family protein n=1 Tax=Vibrio ostreicida TaxID=526588 RepID=A0ABT8BQD9_9VIBR|nr:NAD-dependent epimerase/dehydratase family protein [Vibrio ostreicida]MDN3608465.1 NAD-dependent epimerase/dehydratase family protein [Vibrio ostreicida]MDN3611222.1 NAD-dependent epimerase/dehydratase family protein [Vibrio ostreicida]NPD10287.1 NAD-dependent epimerase/dehydratase family protein [Vibrio ostreicida]
MILLTGASGFVGKEILKSHRKVKSLYRKDSDHKKAPFSCIETLDKNTNFGNAFDGVKTVIHLAGIAHSKGASVNDYRSVNVEGSLNLAIQAANAGVVRFVFVSSIGVNGAYTCGEPFSWKDQPSPHNDYTQSKLDAELGLQRIAEKTGMELVVVRPTLVYGKNAPGNFGLLTQLVSKVPILPFRLIDNKRDFIAVQNLADLLITCTEHPNAGGKIFLASDGQGVSIRQFTDAIAKGLNKGLLQFPIPKLCLQLFASLTGRSMMAKQLIQDLEVDSTNTLDDLGWVAPLTMEQAMSLTFGGKNDSNI